VSQQVANFAPPLTVLRLTVRLLAPLRMTPRLRRKPRTGLTRRRLRTPMQSQDRLSGSPRPRALRRRGCSCSCCRGCPGLPWCTRWVPSRWPPRSARQGSRLPWRVSRVVVDIWSTFPLATMGICPHRW